MRVKQPACRARAWSSLAGGTWLEVIRELRDAQRAAIDEDDPGSAEMFSHVVQVHERHEWFLRNLSKPDHDSSG